MVDVQQNTLPQAGNLNNEENPAIDSDRVKVSVVCVGPADCPERPKNDGTEKTVQTHITTGPRPA